jgi:hypothetical protein
MAAKLSNIALLAFQIPFMEGSPEFVFLCNYCVPFVGADAHKAWLGSVVANHRTRLATRSSGTGS